MGKRSGSRVLLGTALSSAAVLMLEVVLTHVFAVAQFHHFAFVAVSLALLGVGAAGSFHYVWPRLGRGGPDRWATLAGGLGYVGWRCGVLADFKRVDSKPRSGCPVRSTFFRESGISLDTGAPKSYT